MTTTIQPTTGRPSGLSIIRLFRQALTFLALACGLLAPAAQAAIKVVVPTTTTAGSLQITQDITFPITKTGGAKVLVLDEWVNSDGANIGLSISANLTYSINGGANQNVLLIGIYDNQAFPFGGFTANDGYLTLLTAIPVAIGDTLTIRSATFVLPPQGNSSTFNPQANQTFTGNIFVTDNNTEKISSNVPAHTVSGGRVNGANFEIGTVGTTNPANNWPANESPDKAVDGDANTKFLIFQGSNAGLIITPPAGPATYNRLALTTANDAPERDPASYKIYGSTTALPTSGNIAISSLTLIQEGTLALTDVRNNGTTVAGPGIVQFNNTTPYASYLVVFPRVKDTPASNTTLTQIAEVKLSQGLTVPHQVAVGKVLGGRLSGSTWSNGSIRQSGDADGNNWPAGESPDNALDGSTATKYLHVQKPSALGIQPEGGSAVINSLSFWTANDAPERDPLAYAVYGSNSNVNPFFNIPLTGSWILLQDSVVPLPPDRNSGPVMVSFPNTTSYKYYVVVFKTVKNSPSTNLTQISEVAFANVPQNAAPTDIHLSATSIPENNATGAAIGTLTATDPDAEQTLTFSFGGGSLQSIDNDAFTIEGNQLKLKNTADFETKSSYPVTIRATDNGSPPRYVDKEFTITITDVTIPQTVNFAPLANKTFGDPAFNVSATGGASGQPVTFSLIDANPALFRIQGDTVSFNGAGTVTVRASQAGFGDYGAATPVDRTFTVAKAPQTITFNLATTALTTDTVTLSATGGGSGLPVTFAITNDGPGSISGNQLTFTGPGPVIVQASQAGNANYLAAPDVSRTITASLPVPPLAVVDPTSADITATTATLGGNVTGDAELVSERGVVFSLTSENPDPLVAGSGVTTVTTSGTSGVFTVPITGLLPNRSYSFKAYAEKGDRSTTYSNVTTFTTLAAGESITIAGTTVLSVADIGYNATVPELLTGQTIITGTVKSGELEDSIHFTLPEGKAVISGTLVVSDYVAPIAPGRGMPFIDRTFRYRSDSEFRTFASLETTEGGAVTAPTRCNTNTLKVTLSAPLIVEQLFASGPSGPVPSGTAEAAGSASYVLTLEIGDQETNSQLGNLSATGITTLSPAFAPATTLYSATIPFAQGRVDLAHTFDPLQLVTISVNGDTPQILPISSTGYSAQGMNVGLNTIVYRVCAQDGSETTYTVNITREPDPNSPPTFSSYAFSTKKNTPATVAAAKILARATDTEGGTLSLTAVSATSAQGGSVIHSGGNVTYTPATNHTGLDTFTVTISDGQGGSVTGTVTVDVLPSGTLTKNQAKLTILPGGNVALLFQGIPGQAYEIQRSTDLQTWSTVTTVIAAPDGTLPYTDTNPPSEGSAFYRTAIPSAD